MIKGGQTGLAADFIITLVAGENITANDAIYILASDGKAYKCDADATSTLGFVGFAQETVSTGNNVTIKHTGQMTGFAGLTIGAQYYVSGTAGGITATPPTNVKIVGVALSATVIQIASYPTIRESLFIASGTWTKLPGLKFVVVKLVGGGGGGAGDRSGSSDGGGGGGGGGGYSEKWIPAGSLGATETVTIGAAGAGGATAAAGGNGGTTSFGSHCQATGGSGGPTSGGGGGTGGVGSGGQVNIDGEDGGYGWLGFSLGGKGGSSMMGAGGAQTVGGTNGLPGKGNGSGGSGGNQSGSQTNTGGAGTVGAVLVIEHY